MYTDNKDFYPTPTQLINKMLFNIDLKQVKSILEPSTGDGQIVDVLVQKEKNLQSYPYNKSFHFDIDCIESDIRLQTVLRGKGYKLVHDDFLTYNTSKEYDLIIMNPPFSNGVKHILKAIELQSRNGGAIVCLLNAETLKNQCSNDRVLLSQLLEEHNAKIQYIQDAFVDAERKTGVEVALIELQLPKNKQNSFIFDTLKKSQEQKEVEHLDNNQLVTSDFLKAIINQYELEIQAGVKLIKEYYAMQPFILSEFKKNEETGKTEQTGSCILNLCLSGYHERGYSNSVSINQYIREVRGKYWKALFNNQEFTGKLTSNLRQEFKKRVEELKDYDFSLFNIYELKIEISKKMVKGIEETIMDLFEEFSNKYHYLDETSKNIHMYNGWKTNKSWIINKKVIIPLNAYDTYYTSRYQPTNYKIVEKLQDIEKCFNYLDGGLTESIDIQESLKFAEEFEETKDIQLKYFTVTFYKKGTCHITFSNDELLKKFNIFGSQHKGWLPPNYGKKTYSNMTQEEKQVVNSFEGETEYNKVMADTNYYLFDSNSIMMLEEKSA